MAESDARSACVSVLKAIIGACKGGQPLYRLERDYRETEGLRIEYVKFGYPNLIQFLKSIPEIQINGDMLTVYDPKMAHITDMVSKQRTQKKSSKPRYPTNRPNRYSSGPRKPVYAPQRFQQQRKSLFGDYKPSIVQTAPRPLLPATIGAPERTRYGGTVMPVRRGYSTSNAGSTFKTALRSVVRQMNSATLVENNTYQPNTQKPKSCELEEQENVPRRQTYQEQQQQDNQPEKKDLLRSLAPRDYKYTDIRVDEQPLLVPDAHTRASTSHINTQQLAPEVYVSVSTQVDPPKEVQHPPAEVIKPAKLRPFSVMDSNKNQWTPTGPVNIKPVLQAPRLTPSQRLQKIQNQHSHDNDLPSQPPRVENMLPRTVVVERKQLTVQIDNSFSDFHPHNDQGVRLEYRNMNNENEEFFTDNHESDYNLGQASEQKISYKPEGGFDARYLLLKPIYKNSQLIGDNFFLNMATQRNDINSMENPHTVLVDGKPFRCGLCISGLTIEDCFHQLLKCKVFRERVVLMVGAIDVMKGKTFTSMKMAMARVIEFLLESKVTLLVICTLPPILTANLKQRNVLMEFNEYINHMAAGSKRIFCFNIFFKFLDKDSKMDESFFEGEPTTLDIGKVVKLHLWSQKGCKLVLHELDKFLHALPLSG